MLRFNKIGFTLLKYWLFACRARLTDHLTFKGSTRSDLHYMQYMHMIAPEC
jgi:hypothetical protein